MSIILDSFGIDPCDPNVVAIQEDFGEFANLISGLVERRKARGLTQADVAALMGTKQSAVSAIESSSANPSIQRLQRYARAVGTRLTLGADDPVSADSEWHVLGSPWGDSETEPQSQRPQEMLVGGPEWKEWNVDDAA